MSAQGRTFGDEEPSSFQQALFNHLAKQTHLMNAQKLGDEIVREVTALQRDLGTIDVLANDNFKGFQAGFSLSEASVHPGKVTIDLLHKKKVEQGCTPQRIAEIELSLSSKDKGQDVDLTTYHPQNGEKGDGAACNYNNGESLIKSKLAQHLMSAIPNDIRLKLFEHYEKEGMKETPPASGGTSMR